MSPTNQSFKYRAKFHWKFFWIIIQLLIENKQLFQFQSCYTNKNEFKMITSTSCFDWGNETATCKKYSAPFTHCSFRTFLKASRTFLSCVRIALWVSQWEVQQSSKDSRWVHKAAWTIHKPLPCSSGGTRSRALRNDWQASLSALVFPTSNSRPLPQMHMVLNVLWH